MSMSKKRLTYATIVGIIVLLLVSGCSGSNGKNDGETSSNGEIKLTMLSSWSTEEDRGKALHDVINNFNEEYEGEIKVEVDINPDWPALQEKTKQMISADQTPDIFNYNYNPYDLSRQESGKLIDFQQYMDEEWKDRFKEGDLEELKTNGEITAIPFEKAGVLFYYNKDLFAEAGIESFPKTWDEFIKVSEQLKANGITPISLMTSDDAWHATNLFSYLAASFGGIDVFDIEQSLDSEAIVKAADMFNELFQYTTSDAVGANYSVSSNHFNIGNTAMIIDGPWLIGNLDEGLVDSVGIATSPTFDDGTVPEGFIITDTYTPWSAGKQKSEEKEEAIVEFMKYMTSEESSKHFTLEGNILLSTNMDLNDEELQSAGPILGQFINESNQATESLVQVSRVLKPNAIAKLPSLIENLVLDQITPEEFAAQLQLENEG